VTDDRKFITVAEAAEILRVHPESVRRMIRAGKIPRLQVGQTIRIPADALDALVSVKDAS
jgi:excisionase family DNA binding protein